MLTETFGFSDFVTYTNEYVKSFFRKELKKERKRKEQWRTRMVGMLEGKMMR